ncbi:MAG TPA: helix-turn-helix transcriptional regulator [Solirubrobacterales bacterium]
MDDGVGATLREVRTRRKIDLESVEAAIKIRVRYLRAIENEEWELLPGDAYARGFVRTYANFLGLDGTRLADEYRRGSGVPRPAERLPRVEAGRPPRGQRAPWWPRVPGWVSAVAVSAVLIAILIAIGLAGGGGSGGPAQSAPKIGIGQAVAVSAPGEGGAAGGAQTLTLLARAEVWVCLLDAGGKRLVNGQILGAEREAGPFRSGSFTVALGNGEVAITVDGKQANIPESSSPVGYAIGADGKLREIPEGERPTCT